METSVNKEYDKVTQNGVGKSDSTPWDRKSHTCIVGHRQLAVSISDDLFFFNSPIARFHLQPIVVPMDYHVGLA